ncbi:MAG: GAF domain-containing protein, partial [Arenibacterium sp.]
MASRQAPDDRDALEQALATERARLAATSDILRVIAESRNDAQPVFDAVIKAAVEVSNARFGFLLHVEDGLSRYCASYGYEADGLDAHDARATIELDEGTIAGKVVQARGTIWIEDAQSPDYYDHELARENGVGKALGVPIRVGDTIWGVISLGWLVEQSPGEEEARIVETFADQAAIAIENARQFRETEAALEKQTASANILRVISQSPTDVTPVFDVIVKTASQLINCDLAIVHLTDDMGYWPAAAARRGGGMVTEEIVQRSMEDTERRGQDGRPLMPIDPEHNLPSRAIIGQKTLHVTDWDPAHLPPLDARRQKQLGIQCALFLPLL